MASKESPYGGTPRPSVGQQAGPAWYQRMMSGSPNPGSDREANLRRQRQLASTRDLQARGLRPAFQPEPGPWYGEGREDSPFNDAFAAHRKRMAQGLVDPASYQTYEQRGDRGSWLANPGPGKGGQVQAPADRMQRQLDSDLSHEAAFSKSPLFKHIAGRGGQGGAPVVPESQGTYDGPVSGGNIGKMDQLGKDISSFQRPHSGYKRSNPGVGGGRGRTGPPPRGGRRGGGNRRNIPKVKGDGNAPLDQTTYSNMLF